MKERLDIMLVNQGLSASRERAKATIINAIAKCLNVLGK